jgi:large subunit ribosomal protein L14
MISAQSKLKVSDNSGVKKVQCIKTYNKKFKGRLGDIILVSIKALKIKTKLKEKLNIKKGNIFKALIVRTAYKEKNIPETFIKFSENSVILLNSSEQPIATRILGPITRSLRKNKKIKILSIASNII